MPTVCRSSTGDGCVFLLEPRCLRLKAHQTKKKVVAAVAIPLFVPVLQGDVVCGGEIDFAHAQQDVGMWDVIPHEVVLTIRLRPD